MSEHWEIVRQFERALCRYTGARYAVATTSCSMALLLACAWLKVQQVEIPKLTYVSVPMAIIHAGGTVTFRDEDWQGEYRLKPYPIWDCARRFTSGMYRPGQVMCVSFHWTKILGLSNAGGAVLLDDWDGWKWLRRACYDGRTESMHPRNDPDIFIGWRAFMSPATAAEGLTRLASLPERSPDLPRSDYADLSAMACFEERS